MQPRNLPCRCSVVNAPRSSAKWEVGGCKSSALPSKVESMAWCAKCNKMSRSCWEYSGAAGLTATFASDCGDIVALSAPAQYKRTPLPAPFRMLVDLAPEGGEVVSRRDQRQPNHNPDRGQRNRMHWEPQEIPWQVCPVMVDNRRYDRDDLHQHLPLSQIAGLDRKA